MTSRPRTSILRCRGWSDAKDDWTWAHESAQQGEGPAGAWVHAYLHRKVIRRMPRTGIWVRASLPTSVRYRRNGPRLWKLLG